MQLIYAAAEMTETLLSYETAVVYNTNGCQRHKRFVVCLTQLTTYNSADLNSFTADLNISIVLIDYS